MGRRKVEQNASGMKKEKDIFHVIHKVPFGDNPYAKAKHAQLVEKDLEKAVIWFWKAINERDRVDSALKDMVLVMKQLGRTEEAIEAIKSFRDFCSMNSRYSLDNLLMDLYKKSGRVEEQIEVIKKKLWMIYRGETFDGRPTKTARSHGKKFQVTVKQEISGLLGNLGWAYMQKSNYTSAEVAYRKAKMVYPEAKKTCNLGLCLIKQARFEDARLILNEVLAYQVAGSDNPETRRRAEELMAETYANREPFMFDDDGLIGVPLRSRRLPIFEEISSLRDELIC